jgi:hypothetical protein
MRIDPRRIKIERARRAWSQQHLATVSGLSLRTVQRAEQSGLASYETASALAACLEVPVASLAGADTLPVGRAPGMVRKSTAWLGMATAFLAGTIVTVTQSIVAQEATVDISVREHRTVDDDSSGELVFESQGASLKAEVPQSTRVSDSISLTLLPRLVGEVTVFAVTIVDERKDRNPLSLSPILVVRSGDEGSVFIADDALGSRVSPFARSRNQPGYTVRILPKIPPASAGSGASR